MTNDLSIDTGPSSVRQLIHVTLSTGFTFDETRVLFSAQFLLVLYPDETIETKPYLAAAKVDNHDMLYENYTSPQKGVEAAIYVADSGEESVVALCSVNNVLYKIRLMVPASDQALDQLKEIIDSLK